MLSHNVEYLTLDLSWWHRQLKTSLREVCHWEICSETLKKKQLSVCSFCLILMVQDVSSQLPTPGRKLGWCPEWMCTIDTALTKTPVPQTHENGKAFPGSVMYANRWLTTTKTNVCRNHQPIVFFLLDWNLELPPYRDFLLRLAKKPRFIPNVYHKHIEFHTAAGLSPSGHAAYLITSFLHPLLP